ncbi:MAG: amidase [Gammaproteobacteria bacterium]|nr:amidase [Gammaproteobacteria bacterium]
MSDILYRSAFALAKDIKRGVLTSSGVLEFFLDRVDRFNPEINAVVQLDADRARERAAAADRAARRGEDLGPLHGVPLTIKDAYLTEGIVSANGMPEYRDNVPTRNSDAVQRYVDAGAIVFGKTNTPYASGDWQSFNSVYGTTGNPWDSARTCGGSSGGAGAALAAGMTPLELGGDIGGSIRIPAHFNGVFGHKPSHGIVSQRNVVDWQEQLGEQDLWVVGPMGITARDVRDALRLLVGATAEKAVAWRVELPAARTTDVTKLRVATCFERPDYPVDAEVLALLQGVARTLAECGARVDHDTVPGIDFDENFSLYLQLMYSHMGEDTPEKIRQGMAAMLRPLARGEEIVAAMGSSLTRWLAVHERRLQLQRKWVEFFEDYDVLLAPVLPLPAFVHDQRPMGKRTWAINGIERTMMFDVLFWAAFSLVTYLPATVAPAGRTRANLPVGIQIVGPYLEDETPLAVAAMLEERHARFEPPPGYG